MSKVTARGTSTNSYLTEEGSFWVNLSCAFETGKHVIGAQDTLVPAIPPWRMVQYLEK